MKFTQILMVSVVFAVLLLAAITPMAIGYADSSIPKPLVASEVSGEEPAAQMMSIKSVEDIAPVVKATITSTLVRMEKNTVEATSETDPEPTYETTPAEETIPETTTETPPEETIPESTVETIPEETIWQGEVLTARRGTVQGPSGRETWYNLPMGGVIELMKKEGYFFDYWIREDGCKMYGPYIMCAADLKSRPRGTILETSLGTAMVCDYCEFAAKWDNTHVDIAVNW